MQDRREAYKSIFTSSMTILSNPGFSASSQNEPLTLSKVAVTYTLPHPTSITDELVAKGVAPETAELISEAYLRHAMASKQIHEQHLNSVLCRIEAQTDSPPPTLLIREAYKAEFQSRLASWLNQALLAYQRRLRGQRSASAAIESSQDISLVREQSKTFKSEALQLLEQAFDVDPYPERTDKVRLAEETGMDYKQVNVWFQNRRNRSKKNGKLLKKTTFINLSVAPSRTLPSPGTPESSDGSGLEPAFEPSASFNRGERESVLNPPHSPQSLTPYHLCDEKRPSTSFEYSWLRHPADKPLPNRAIDDEELVSAFAEICISDMTVPSMSTQSPKVPRSSPRFCHCSSPVTLPSAPLPALLNRHIPTVKTPTVKRRRRASIRPWRHCQFQTTSNGSTTKVVVGVRAAAHPYIPHRGCRSASTRSSSAGTTSTSRSNRSVSGSSSDGSSLCTPPSTPAKSAAFIFYKPRHTSPEPHSS